MTAQAPALSAAGDLVFDNLALALSIARRGWAIFPCKQDKKPQLPSAHPEGDPLHGICKGACGKDGHGYKDATTNPDKIKAWWKAWPKAIIGIACAPSGIFAVDIDVKNGIDGLASWFELVDIKGGGEAPECGPYQTTPSGGHHLIFKMPADVKIPNNASKLGPGLDLRSDGYICTGSLANGSAYTWQPEQGPESVLTEAPGWLLDLIRDMGKVTTQPIPAPSQSRPAGQSSTETGDYWLNKALSNGKIGTGDETGLWLAVQLRDHKLSEGEIMRYCKIYAEKVEQNSSDPFTDKDAERWVNSALTREARDPAKRQGGPSRGSNHNGHHPQGTANQAAQTPPVFIQGFDERGEYWTEKPQAQTPTEALQPTQPTPGAYRLDDIGNGERLARRHGWRLRHVKEFGWMVYNGKAWEGDRGQAAQLAKETARSIYAEAAACEDDNLRNALAAWAKASASESKRGAMLAAAASEPGIIAAPKDFDADPWLLNCDNGVLNLRTGELGEHNPGLLFTKKAGAAYDPGATCPTWRNFLARIFTNNQAVINFVQRAAGYTLTGNISEQKLFFLYGTGANGKSTFTEALQAALGDYARKTPTETLMQKYQDNGGASPDIARLAGARMVSAAELAEGRRLNEPLIKDMTGGDRMTARYLNKEFFEFSPAFKLWMYGNHQPKITGTDPGIWRRVLLIPFTVSIPESEQDKNLGEKLRAELAGILAWAVAGCIAWQHDGLEVPQEVKDATADYKASQDILALFFAERCVINSLATVQARELYNQFKLWAVETNTDPGSEVNFSRRMTEKGFTKTANTGKGRAYTGIGLVDDGK